MKNKIIAVLLFAGLLNFVPAESKGRGGRGGHRGHRHGHHAHRRGHTHRHGYRGHHRHVHHRYGVYSGYGYGYGWRGVNAAWWGYPYVWQPGIGIYLYSEPGVYRGGHTVFSNDSHSRLLVSSDKETVELRPGEQRRVNRRSCRFTIKNIDTGRVNRITQCTRSIYLTDREQSNEE